MKNLFTAFVLSFLIRPSVAELKIPASVFRAAQFDEAAKQAEAQRKPLAIVVSLESATGGTEEATEEALKEVAGWTVTVFVNPDGKTGGERFHLPPPLAAASVEEGGSPIPRVLIAPPRGDETWAIIGVGKKQHAKDFRKDIKARAGAAKAKAAEFFKNKTTPPPAPPGDTTLFWGLAAGSYYTGKFVRFEKEQLYIADKNNRVGAGIALKDLAPATQTYLKLISGTGTPAPSAAVIEDWQNKQGKAIKATFVALKDGNVTLRLESGKEHTIPLDSLAPVSQNRARELAQKSAPAGK